MRGNKPSSLLVGNNARRADVDQAWEQDNQAWWDWYVSLAENDPRSMPRDVESSCAVDLEQILLAESSQPPDELILNELTTPFPLDVDAVDSFQRNGFVKLQNVLSRAAVSRLRLEMARLLEAQFAIKLDGGIRERFLSMEMVWLDNLLIRAFVRSPRIAGICAALLGVPSVRLYHDNLLSKEPGCGRTPWHYDDHHFPLATQNVVTAWIPAQPIPRSMGPLSFAAPIDSWQLVRDIEFSKFDTSYDRQVSECFRRHSVAIDDGPFALGEVSFHHNLSFHTAGANHTEVSRLVLANTYYADGARVVDQPTMVSGDWQKFIPDTAPGEVAASPLNPVCWPPDASATAEIGGQPSPRNTGPER